MDHWPRTDRDRLVRKSDVESTFERLFKRKRRIKVTGTKRKWKWGSQPKNQKTPPLSFYLQKGNENEVNEIINSRFSEKLQNVKKECLVTQVVVTVKKTSPSRSHWTQKTYMTAVWKLTINANVEELSNQKPQNIKNTKKSPLCIDKRSWVRIWSTTAIRLNK